ncbi:MAG: efflux RND transporter periplasmic adaptor subunit [Bacteroidia bacterium]
MKLKFLYLPILLLLLSCEEEKNSESTKIFPITSPIIIDTSYYQEYVADIHSKEHIELRTRIKGFIDKIYVDEGNFVKKGQLIFSLSKKEYQEQLQRAKAQLKNALADAKETELEVKNIKSLVDKNVVSQTKLDMAKLRLQAKKAKVDEARATESTALVNLSYAEIKAPFDGKIDRIPNKTGSLVDEGTLLTSISDNTEILAYFNITEEEYLNLAKQKKDSTYSKQVELVLANGQIFPYTGIIETSESEFDKRTGNIAFRARFANPKLLLKHGSSGKVRIKNTIKNAIVIPQKATFEIQDRVFIYLVDENNKTKIKQVNILLRLPHLFVVDNLSINDKIIYEGIQNIKEDKTIQTEFISMSEIINELSKF